MVQEAKLSEINVEEYRETSNETERSKWKSKFGKPDFRKHRT